MILFAKSHSSQQIQAKDKLSKASLLIKNNKINTSSQLRIKTEAAFLCRESQHCRTNHQNPRCVYKGFDNRIFWISNHMPYY